MTTPQGHVGSGAFDCRGQVQGHQEGQCTHSQLTTCKPAPDGTAFNPEASSAPNHAWNWTACGLEVTTASGKRMASGHVAVSKKGAPPPAGAPQAAQEAKVVRFIKGGRRVVLDRTWRGGRRNEGFPFCYAEGSGSDHRLARVAEVVGGGNGEFESTLASELCTLRGHDCTGDCICKKENVGRYNEKVVVDEKCPVRGHSSEVSSLAWNHNGSLLASGSWDFSVRLWTPDGQWRGTLRGHSEDNPECTCTHRDKQDCYVYLANPECPVRGHSKDVYSVAFSPDSKTLASASGDETVKLWDLSGDAPVYKGTLTGHSGGVSNVSFSPDGSLLASSSDDETVKLWDPTTMEEKGTLRGHSRDNPECICRCPCDETEWKFVANAECSVTGHSGEVYCVSFSPDGSLLASGSDDKTVKLWDPTTMEEKGTLRGNSDTVFCVAWNHDGSLLASGSCDGTVCLWTPDGQEKGILTGHSGDVNCVAFSPDGSLLASASDDRTVKLWDPTTMEEKGTLTGHSNEVWSISFDKNGSLLASGSADRTVKLWDLPEDLKTLVISKGSAASARQAFVERQERAMGSTINELERLREGTDTPHLVCKARKVAGMLFEGLPTPGAGLLPAKPEDWGANGQMSRMALKLEQLSGQEWKQLPLLALEAFAKELLTRAPAAIEALGEWVKLHTGAVKWHQERHWNAQRDMDDFAKAGLCRTSLHDGSTLLADKAKALHQHYSAPGDGIVALADASKTGTDSAQAAVLESLEGARKRLADAQRSLEAHGGLQALARRDFNYMRTKLLPQMAPEDKDRESRACKQVEDELQVAQETLRAAVEMETELVQALEKALKACDTVKHKAIARLQRLRSPWTNQGAAAVQSLSVARDEVLRVAAKAVEDNRPAEKRLRFVLDIAAVNAAEVTEMLEHAMSELADAQSGWEVLEGEVADALGESRKGMNKRLAAADFSCTEQDDLRCILVHQGLADYCDKITENLDGVMLGNMLEQSGMDGLKFALSLQDALKSGIKLSEDICLLKRVVHCLQLIPFGLGAQASDFCSTASRDGEVGDALNDRCCQWTEARVKMELRAEGVELRADQLSGVTGEVLLLLLDKHQDLEALGVADFKLQRKIIDFAHDRGRSDPVGKLRLGLEKPVVHSCQGTVDADARLACYRSMSCALLEDGPSPLLPVELVLEWTDNFGDTRLIGEGAFGKVYEGIITDDQPDRRLGRVAVKQLSRDVSEGVQQHAKREINALSRFKHPHIIRLLGHTDVKRNPVCLVYDMGSRGSLGKMLRSDDSARLLTWRIRVRVASGLVAALNYLHCHEGGDPVFHRDVKSDNVVLTADFQAKLIDCGLAKYSAGAGQVLAAGTVVTTAGVPVGTALYCCPQYWKGKVDFDARCEVFSVGVVLLELISGQLTSREFDLYELIEDGEEIKADHRAGEWRPGCLEEVESLARECLKKPKGRISSMMTVMRRLKTVEEQHCKSTEEERVKAEELRSVQRELDAARVQGVLAVQLWSKLEKMAAQLTAHRAEQQRAAQRQKEAQQMKREQRQARLRSCLICFDNEVDVGDGVECTGDDTHFLCRGCLNGEVRAQLGLEECVAFRRSGRRIRCRQCPRDGAAACFDTSSFTPLLEPDVFELYLRMREEVVVCEAIREQQGRYELQVKELEGEIAKLLASKMDAVVPVHMKSLIEDVLTDKCPRCKRAFFDFDGCFALTCSGCGCGFCAYCLEDCGSDAHGHVSNCQHNIAPGKDVFGSNGVWLQSQGLRRRRKLEAFIEAIEERAVRGRVLEAARKELEDVGIDVAELLHLV